MPQPFGEQEPENGPVTEGVSMPAAQAAATLAPPAGYVNGTTTDVNAPERCASYLLDLDTPSLSSSCQPFTMKGLQLGCRERAASMASMMHCAAGIQCHITHIAAIYYIHCWPATR